MLGSKGNHMSAEEMQLGWQNRSAQEAVDEVERELNVRLRVFARWVEDGRLSQSDAKDRLQRLFKARALLQIVLDTPAPTEA